MSGPCRTRLLRVYNSEVGEIEFQLQVWRSPPGLPNRGAWVPVETYPFRLYNRAYSDGRHLSETGVSPNPVVVEFDRGTVVMPPETQ